MPRHGTKTVHLVYTHVVAKPLDIGLLSPVHKIDYIGKYDWWRGQRKGMLWVPLELPGGMLVRCAGLSSFWWLQATWIPYRGASSLAGFA